MKQMMTAFLRNLLTRAFQEWPGGQPPQTPRTPPEQRAPWGQPDSAPESNAPTERINNWQSGQPYGAPHGSSLPPNRTRTGAFWGSAILGAIVLLLLATLAFVELGRAGSLFGVNPTHTGNATATATAALPTTTSAFQAFQANHNYVYSDIIGVSKTTALTNNDINVTLETLTLSSATGETTIGVAFQNLDTSKQGDFLFVQRSNVFLIDNQGTRYQAIQANPSEVIVPAGQTANVSVMFPLITTGVTSLDVYFNTDHDALNTTCAKLFPSLRTETC
jgi:hypothetical protein